MTSVFEGQHPKTRVMWGLGPALFIYIYIPVGSMHGMCSLHDWLMIFGECFLQVTRFFKS